MNPLEYAPFFIIAAFLTIAILGFASSWVRRFFTWLKMREDNYLSYNSIDSAHVFLRLILVGLYVISVLLAAHLLPGSSKDPFTYASNYIFLFNAFLTFSVFSILAILASSAIANHRVINAIKDENAVIKSGVMEFYELFLKYGMLLLGLFIAVLVGLITIPDDSIRQQVYNALHLNSLEATNIGAELLFLLIVLLVLFIVQKFIEIILDDFKGRSKKFQPGIIDLIKAGVKYSIYWLAAIIIILVILETVQPMIAYIVIGFIMLITAILITVVGISPAFRNAICGIILLVTDSINKGDWVRIGDNNTGEVVSQGLVITSLKTRTGDLIDLPNELILNSYIHNYTKLGGTMVRLVIEIKTQNPPESVESLLLNTAEGLDESKLITSERAVLSVAITNLKADSVEYTLGIWRKDPVTMEATVSTFLKKFHTVAKSNGIIVLDTRVKM